MLPEMFTTTRDLPASAGTGIGAGESICAMAMRGMTTPSPASWALTRTSLSV